MSAKFVFIIATVAVMAFASSSDAFAAKNGKSKRAQNNVIKHEKSHRFGRRVLPVHVILNNLRDRGFRRLSVRDTRRSGYKIAACKRGRKLMLGVSRRGEILWRERTGRCLPFHRLPNYGNSFIFRFNL